MVKYLSLVAKCLSLFLAASSFVDAASLQQVSNFGTNPTGTQMFIYVPDRVATKPAILVAMHYCTGTAQAYFSGTGYRQLADTHGFIVIYPDAPDSGGCWDVHSTQTLTHDAGGDSLGIASMVRYTIRQYSADAGRVYMTGTSSGAMMTNVLAGAYPDMFQAGAAVAGVPYGCFAGASMWNSQCASGQLTKTPQQWGDLVRSGYPGYSGRRPRMQIWHGTNDDTLRYQNFNEAIKQWTNVFGVSQTPTSTQTNNPASGWTRTKYGDNFEALSQQGGGHNIPVMADQIVAFLGILNPPQSTGNPTATPTTTPPPTTTPVTTPPPTTTTPPTGGTVPKWGQCGGIGYTGPTTCVAGSTCQVANPYYSQCL